jgi:hypothetical protein
MWFDAGELGQVGGRVSKHSPELSRLYAEQGLEFARENAELQDLAEDLRATVFDMRESLRRLFRGRW